MLDINLRISFGGDRHYRRAGDVMSDAMVEFLKQRRLKNDRDDRAAELSGLARAKTGDMYNRLVRSLTDHVASYKAATGKGVQVHPDPHLVIVSDKPHPTIFLKVTKDSDFQPVIHCEQNVKLSTSAKDQYRAFDIEVIAKGQDQYFFRFEGVDLDHTELCDALMIPLYRNLD